MTSSNEPSGSGEPVGTEPMRVYARNRGFAGFDYENEGQWQGPFVFVQAADTQLGMIDSYENQNHVNPGWAKELELMGSAIARVNSISPRPRFMVVCGDLVDAMPGVSYKADQIRDFKKLYGTLHPDIKPVCVCGNHDVGDVPSPAAIEAYREDFGDEHFSFWVGGCKFLVINAQLYHDSSLVPNYKREQDIWLERELGLDSATRPWRHLVGFQHIPPFISDPEEGPVEVPGTPNLNFNFANRRTRLDFLTKLKASGMGKLFCGHYHRNAGGWDGPLEVIVTSAVGCQLGNDGHGLRVVKVLPNAISHRYYRLEDIPESVDLES